MNNKYTYVIIGIVVVFIIILIYQKQSNDLKIQQQQQLLLAQNPNVQFGQYGGWAQLFGNVLGGFTQAYVQNAPKDK